MLISYENEAIAIERQGKPVEHIIPEQTFKIENPVAVVTTSAAPGCGKRVQEFSVHRYGTKALGAGRFPGGRSRGRQPFTGTSIRCR